MHLNAGMIVICAKCRKPYAKITKDLGWGRAITPSMLQGLQIKIEQGCNPRTNCCGELWLKGAGCQVFTERGWLPSDN